MSSQPRIFVSHSSSDRAFTESVAAALRAPAGARGGFEVLLDLDCLAAGRPWPTQLHAMMADADAGLVLLTPSALARPDWVRKEVFILTWRASLDPTFPVFVVQLPEVTAADLSKAELDPAHLPELQRVRETEPAAIAESLRADGPRATRHVSTYQRLVASLADMLATVGEAKLDQVARQLGTERPRWRPAAADRRGALLEAVVAQLLAGNLGSYRGLRDLVNDLKAANTTDERLRKVVRLVAPYWVPPEDAGRLCALVAALAPRTGTPPEGGCAVALEGRHVPRYTAAMYVTRAYPFESHLFVESVACSGTGRFGEDYGKQVCELARRRRRRLEDLDDEAVVAELRQKEPWLFVILPPPPDSDAGALAALRARFPRVVFIVWPGTKLPAVPAEFDATRLAVDLALERASYDDWDDAVSALEEPTAAARRP